MHTEITPEEDYETQLAETLQVFGGRLSKLASTTAQKRSMIEQRWLEDYRQYHGKYDEETQARLSSDDAGSKIFVNITRNKTSAAEARLQDMLFPTDDRNWAIRPTPRPELENFESSESVQINGQPVEKKALAEEIQREAKKRSDAMQREIDDQLNEANYQVKARDLIHDACLLGTAVLKGPVVIGRSKKTWRTEGDITQLQIEESLEPAVERVDIWDFFPDPSARTIKEVEYVFERHRLNKKQLREFAKLPGVLLDQLRDVMRGGSKGTQVGSDHTADIRSITGIDSVADNARYEMWEYHGPIDVDELIAAGIDIEDDDDPLKEYEGVVFFIGNTVVRVSLNPMDTEELPYSVFNWEKDDASIFGFGVPYLMRNPQKVINSAWRMMMDNGGLSVADQIVINAEIVEPVNGRWQLEPKKVWKLKDKSRTVRDAFGSFSTQSHQAELANIFTMARQLADEETNMPLIAQGEQSSHVTKTSSGMAMLMNSANIVLRRAVKNWDDDITNTLIPRYYDFNMQFSEKEEIKGDFKIDARGSSALLVREKQQENLMIFSNISASNPHLAVRRDWAGLDSKIAQALEVPHDDITLPKADIEQAMEAQAESQPQDPQIVRSQMQHEYNMQRLSQEEQYNQAKLNQDRELKLVEIASKENITLEQLNARVQSDFMKDKTARDKAAGELNHKQTETQMRAANIANGFDSYN